MNPSNKALMSSGAHRQLFSGVAVTALVFLAGLCSPVLSASLNLSPIPLFLMSSGIDTNGCATETGSTSVATNSGSISSDTRVFQARFDPKYWEGHLLSYSINTTTGALITPEWDAGAKLPSPNNRHIITLDTAGTPVAFQWATLDVSSQNLLDPNAIIGEAKLDYLRGAASNEAPSGYRFRLRPNDKLGDIVNSSPTFVGKPSFRYRDSLESGSGSAYSAFVNAQINRQPMLYVGANDGMLHAFSGITGVEIFAYIPRSVFNNLSALTSATYSHKFFVDGTPQMGDAFFDGAWHTMLVGGLNSGGQGIYALEITDPSTFIDAETSPASIAKWEFTDTADADLGFTFSQPQIVRLHNGKWAAVFGNGYNNRDDDDYQSKTGHAALFVVDIEDGSLIRKISITGLDADVGSTSTPNGLATPALVDLDGDRIVDYAYAGDLFGNLWKFDLTSSSPASWHVSHTKNGSPAPLFVAEDSSATPHRQPITQRPVVVRGPHGAGMTVLFGTGKYLEDKVDNSLASPVIQTFYGIYDVNTVPVSDADIVADRASLQQQSILWEIVSDLNGSSGPNAPIQLRITSSATVPDKLRGWYLDLLSPNGYQSEKSVSNALVRDGRVMFTTLIPSSNPCGGYSWSMQLDAQTGARLTKSPFDLNNDRNFNSADFVTLSDGTRMLSSGLKSAEALLSAPWVLSGGDREFQYAPGTSGNVLVTIENPGKSGAGRQSWRQIR